MTNFLLISVCLLAGILIQRYKSLPPGSYKAVNAWVINIALPAIALKYLPKVEWDISLALPFLTPLLIWVGSYLFIRLIHNFLPMDPRTRAALYLTAGLGNTSFLGFPLSEAYYGEEGLKIAILVDQGCFIVMSTLGIMSASRASSGGEIKLHAILKKIVSFPPFLAFFLALILPPFISFDPIEPLLDILGATLVPLALFSVGLQLKLRFDRQELQFVNMALIYKLILAPLMIFLIGKGLGLEGLNAQISVFEAGMAPMVTGAIIATDYNLRPKLANLILSVGIPVSLLTTFLWSLVLTTL